MNFHSFCKKYPYSENVLTELFSDIEGYEFSQIKSGMTNISYMMSGKKSGKRYVLRIPGIGSDVLVDRYNEAEVYKSLEKCDISEEFVYLNPQTGFKVSKFIENSRQLDISKADEIALCIGQLKKLHEIYLDTVEVYDFFHYIDHYEKAKGDIPSAFEDYAIVKSKIMSFKKFVDEHKKPYCLIHNDISPDNCLIIENHEKKEARLIDWEYAALQDPDTDIAYFCVVSDFSEDETEKIIDAYLEDDKDAVSRVMIYVYIAINGLVQSNWMEFQNSLGAGDIEETKRFFSLAKKYYAKAESMIEELKL